MPGHFVHVVASSRLPLALEIEAGVSGPIVSGSTVPRIRTDRGITTGWTALPRVGGAVRLRRGRLEHAPLYDNNATWQREPDDIVLGDGRWFIAHEEIHEPEWVDPLFLRLTNAALGTDFTEHTFHRVIG